MPAEFPHLWRRFQALLDSDTVGDRQRLIRLLTTATIPQLRYLLHRGRETRDWHAVRTAELFLLSKVVMGNASLERLVAALRRYEEVTLFAKESLAGFPLRRSLARSTVQFNRDVQEAFADMVERSAELVIESQRKTLDMILTPAQKRAATGLPIDDDGNVKPAPGPMPSNIEDESMSLFEIVTHASTLLWAGVTLSKPLAGAANLIVNLEPSDLVNVAGLQDGLDHWRKRIKGLLLPVRETVTKIVAAPIEKARSVIRELVGLPVSRDHPPPLEPSEPGDRPRKPVGKPSASEVGGKGVGSRLRISSRHEIRRMYEHAMDRVREGNDIFLGYQLHSVFIQTTRPLHASNDGMKFYKDNREGSDRPWSRRIIPPYGPNCLCFTRDIVEDAVGREYFIRWQFTDQPGYEELEVREVGTWAQWFDMQRPGIKKRMIGERRYKTIFDRLGRVEYADIVGTKGRFLSVASLRREDNRRRRNRRRHVLRQIRRTQQQANEAYREGKGQWDLTPFEERQYRRRQEVFARRAA